MRTPFYVAIVLGTFAPSVGVALAQSATSTLSTVATDFAEFMSAATMRSLAERDWAALNADPLSTILYVRTIVEKTEAPDAWYRMGQNAELELDPRLGRVMDTKFLTSEALLNAMMGFGSSLLVGTVQPFVQERRENVAAGTVNPAGEMAALMSGMINSSGNMGGLVANAEYDAKVLMLMAQTDLPRFRGIYAAIRDYVYEGM